VAARLSHSARKLAGWLLVAWIMIEVAFIRTFSSLQPICAVMGGVLVILARRTVRS
jgi:hypothetical protein